MVTTPCNNGYPRCLCPDGTLPVGEERCVDTCDHVTCPPPMSCLLETNYTISCLCPDGEVYDGVECVGACTETSCPGNMTCTEHLTSFK